MADFDNLNGPERMYREELAALGASLEAVIVRAVRDWMPDYYAWRVIRADGTAASGILPWDINTFPAVLAAVKGA